ncbi:hypothetical protein LXA43DRAFT_882228 [Ganoderma leucocontextum]|nr:hypothetical protein LXA43DRAFT_882228 [Ganoderma leucocontextum]
MAQEDRPSKRPRTAADDAVRDILQHHEEFWLNDGNIVLVARNIAFRVYCGLLVTQSTVFADMFASSSPNSDETIEGCPVVHISDSPEDFAHLLRVLLPTTHRQFHREKGAPKRSFNEVFAVIRLAHKYNIEDVQRQALSSLREYTFNDNFAVWRDARDEPIPVDDACAIGAVNLARLLDVPEMLPIALYKCLGLGTCLFDGWRRRDGSIEYLSQDDIKRCFAASDELSAAHVSLVTNIYYPVPSDGCKDASLCESYLQQILLATLKYNPVEVADGSDVMASSQHLITLEAGDYGLCAACEQELKDRDVRGREKIWNRFPQIFDIVAKDWGKGV